MIVTPNETYEVSGQIRIQKGNKTAIRRFRKRDMEHNGPVDEPKFYFEILKDFKDEVMEEGEQTTLSDKPQEKASEKPVEKKPLGQEMKKK